MSHYILVHGAWEQARAWDQVRPVLEQAGHIVTAIDLPGHGANTQPLAEVTLHAYVQSVVATISALETPVVLVGHSMAGAVPRTYIRTGNDRVTSPALQDAMIGNWPVDAVLDLASGHFPLFSAPRELAGLLLASDAGTTSFARSA